jgi:hypothetical protein
MMLYSSAPILLPSMCSLKLITTPSPTLFCQGGMEQKKAYAILCDEPFYPHQERQSMMCLV